MKAGKAAPPRSLVARALCERIRKVCELRNVTQARLAGMAQISGAALNRMLRGTTEPTPETVERLHAALDALDLAEQPADLSPKRRGVARLTADQRTAFARRGGLAVTTSGTAHVFTDEERRRGGERGGRAVAQNSSRMSDLGRQGARRRWDNAREAREAAAPAPERREESEHEDR